MVDLVSIGQIDVLLIMVINILILKFLSLNYWKVGGLIAKFPPT